MMILPRHCAANQRKLFTTRAFFIFRSVACADYYADVDEHEQEKNLNYSKRKKRFSHQNQQLGNYDFQSE